MKVKGIQFRKHRDSFKVIIKMPPPQNSITCDFKILMKKISQDVINSNYRLAYLRRILFFTKKIYSDK